MDDTDSQADYDSDTQQQQPPASHHRVGALLSAYYQLDESGDQQQPSSASAGDDSAKASSASGGMGVRRESKSDIDGPNFDVHSWFQELVTNTELSQMLTKSKELTEQVSTLDGDMQMLVYENYNKFITATDTIKSMKANIESMESEMSRLTQRINSINQCSTRLNATLAGRPEKIQELVGVLNVLQKLQLLKNLPQVLKRYLDSGDFESAVRTHRRWEVFLGLTDKTTAAEGHPKKAVEVAGAFTDVAKEVWALMSAARSAMKSRLDAPPPERERETDDDPLGTFSAVHLVKVLLLAGEDPTAMLDTFLQGRRRALDGRLKVIVERAEKEAAAQRRDRDAEDEREPFVDACHGVAASWIPPLCDIIRGAEAAFKLNTDIIPSTIPDTYPTKLDTFLADNMASLCESLGALMRKRPLMPVDLPQTVPVESVSSSVGAIAPKVIEEGLRLVGVAVQQGGRGERGLPVLEVARAWPKYPMRIAGLGIELRFAANTELFLNHLRQLHQCCGPLTAIKSPSVSSAAAAGGSGGEGSPKESTPQHQQQQQLPTADSVLERVGKVEHSVLYQTTLTLTEVAPYLSVGELDAGVSAPKAKQALQEGIFTHTATLFETFAALCRIVTGRETDVPLEGFPPSMSDELIAEFQSIEWRALFALALVRIGRHLEQRGLQRISQMAVAQYPGQQSTTFAQTTVPALTKKTRQAAQRLLSAYAFHTGQQLSHLLRKSIRTPDWLHVREPRDVRWVMEVVVKEVREADNQLARMLGDPRKPKQHAIRSSALLRIRRTQMELEMDRLFARKVLIFGEIPFNRNGAVVGILRIAFKALYELVRDETFGKFGLQQIQVDCAFLSDMIRELVEQDDANGLDGLLDEVVTSASQRCVDPVLMDPAIVETLCDEKRARMDFSE